MVLCSETLLENYVIEKECRKTINQRKHCTNNQRKHCTNCLIYYAVIKRLEAGGWSFTK